MRGTVRSCWRLICLSVILALILSLAPLPPLAPGSVRADDPASPPLPPNTRHESPPLPLPQRPGLALAVAVAPDTLAVGMAATVTVTILNDGE